MTHSLPLTSPLLPPVEFGQYERGCELGHGAFGRVFECTKSGSDETLAVKVMHLRCMRLSLNAESEMKKLKREVTILKNLPPHPKIVQMVDAVEEGDWFFLVLELVRGGDLFSVLMDRPGPKPRLLEREASFIFWQLVKGLAFLHNQGIVHRDLKLENVLIASEQREDTATLYDIKISDFGLSKEVHSAVSQPFSMVGTLRYAAPEVMSGRTYDFQVDLWSLGVLLYILLAGSYPHDKPAQVAQDVLDGIVAGVDASCPARSLLTSLLQLDPKKRTSLELIQQRVWLGTEARPLLPDPPLEPSLSQSTESLFGSADLSLPPPAPGATPGLSSVASVPRITELEPEGDKAALPQCPPPRLPSAASELRLADTIAQELRSTSQSRLPSAASELRLADSIAQELRSRGLEAGGRAGGVPSETQARPPTFSDQNTLQAAEHGLADAPEVIAKRIPESLGPEAKLALSTVRAANAGVNDMHLLIVVPHRYAGAVLGKAGAKMKQVKAATGCNMWMTPRNGAADRCVVIVAGYLQSCRAQMMCIDNLSEAMKGQDEELHDVTVVLFLRDEVAGIVVGKKGSTLQQIQTQSGAKIQLLRAEVDSKRPCIITGPFQNVLRAEQLIFDLVRGVTDWSHPTTDWSQPHGRKGETSGKRHYDAEGSSRGSCSSQQLRSAAAPKRLRLQESGSEEGSTKMLVPSSVLGAVIGRQGMGLSHISRSHNVRMEVLQAAQAPEWLHERVVIVHGDVDSRQAAVDAILRAAFPVPKASCSFKLVLASARAESVFGPQRGALQTVGNLCGIRAHLEPKEVTGERVVVAEGRLIQVVAAATAILGIVDQAS